MKKVDVSGRWVSLLVLCGLCVSVMPARANHQCLERLFDGYCLGGDIAELQQTRPEFLYQQRKGLRYALVYGNGAARDYVMAYRGRIYKVLRQFHPATSAAYRQLREMLRVRYGMPRELSRFPWYARGLSSKINAIRRGEGLALLRWEPDDRPWRVELSWTAEMGLHLAYIAVGGEDPKGGSSLQTDEYSAAQAIQAATPATTVIWVSEGVSQAAPLWSQAKKTFFAQ